LTLPDRSKKDDASKSGSGSDQTGFRIVKKCPDPEQTMLGSWSYIEEFQFPCWSQCCGYESIFSDSDPKIFFSGSGFGFGFGFRFYAMYTVRYRFAKKKTF
jgi:hypothetical protein